MTRAGYGFLLHIRKNNNKKVKAVSSSERTAKLPNSRKQNENETCSRSFSASSLSLNRPRLLVRILYYALAIEFVRLERATIHPVASTPHYRASTGIALKNSRGLRPRQLNNAVTTTANHHRCNSLPGKQRARRVCLTP